MARSTEDAGQPQQERAVTPLELFFDLVFVFAITQVTGLISRDPTWAGLLRGMLLLGVLWWAWTAYAWLTNTLDPEEGGVRLAVLAAIAAMLVASLAAPRAFGADAVVFAVAYMVVRMLHIVLFAIAGRDDAELLRAVLLVVPAVIAAPGLLLIAAFTGGRAQIALWGVALLIDTVGPVLGGMRGGMRGWRISPGHFVERFGQIIIIAIGESVVAIGVGAAGLRLGGGVIVAALLGMTVAACLWWSYFDWVTYVAAARLAQATGVQRAALARDAYSYLHLPMVAGIVLFAFGLKTALHGIDARLGSLAAFGLVGGLAVYLLATVALRMRIVGGIGRGRPIAAAVLLASLPAARVVPALAALGIVTAVCVAVIVYEVLRHRAGRAWIRSHRGGFTMEEANQAATTFTR